MWSGTTRIRIRWKTRKAKMTKKKEGLPPKPTEWERAAAKFVYAPGSCWVWTGAVRGRMYGAFLSNNKQVAAHRFMYEHLVGKIPDGLVLDHLCREPLCVNPAHLDPVSAKENCHRSLCPAALNALKTECIHGHSLSGSNLYTERGRRRGCRSCAITKSARYRSRKKEMACAGGAK